MKAAIASKYYRSAGNQILFDVDERSIKDPNKQRNIVQGNYLDNTYFLIDWGYQHEGATIDIGNLIRAQERRGASAHRDR
jgi:hypothetical protein